ncbi:indolepyruvate ferredoxin oxidoreductase subunit alpha [Govanella unica]|uniref:Indolepyruvate ferredoxin oxidoreductase subunit alpha n=1 Tax=Govanella unica TaxID=2975056 RepID=A0A9X3TX44_9PROT|nr:indolepyruvate ferredoxin oxidoreductase subunit alpha [Govania unica]MDA5193253.1 indolepyruvate ferredoxin oxidoreductase subunit alpha [Govania unica]
MAERSFKEEVKKLRLTAGEEFRGEGILAVTKALLQSGVAYVGGYQGAPISHLMDVLADAEEILTDLGVHFEASASEAAAGAMLAASVNYPLRGAVTWKSTVGTNVASDALANVASGGVKGGALIIIGEDYGEGSSIMQERSHAFAMKSQIWLMDPRPNLEMIVDSVEKGFQLSEASSTPVMLELRIRNCHMYGRFIAKDNRAPEFSIKQAMETPERDVSRIVLPPYNYMHEKEKLEDRWPAAVKFIRDNKLNEFLGGTTGDVGIVVQGGIYNTLIRALELIGLADSFGNTDIPIYVMNVTYPLIPEELIGFCVDKRAVLMVEEGQPDYIEQNLHSILRKADVQTKVIGKDVLPMAGEYTSEALRKGLTSFLETHAADLMATAVPISHAPDVPAELLKKLPPRHPGFCTGCPERPVFTAIKLIERELGPHHISCDIGCHLFSINAPFNLGNTTMGYGLGFSGASAFNVKADKRAISIMGDGGFWHNGLTSGVGNAVFNKSDNVLVIVDNNYAAATGGQDILSSRASNPTKSTNHPIAKAVRGVGVKWIRQTRSYDLTKMRDALRDALTSKEPGPKVIIAEGECMLNLQRREKPKLNARIKSGERVVKERFYVDSDTCTGDHACVRLSGCPSLTIKDNPNPLKRDPIAYVDSSCVGCGHCGEVAHAAVLCPSFARVELIHNPTSTDRIMDRVRKGVIGFLQKLTARPAFNEVA